MSRFILVCALAILAAVGASAQDGQPCQEPEARQFDFWLGEWEVHAGDKIVGHNRISRIHGGCTLLEEYRTAGGYEGKSFNYHDPAGGVWHQVWVDNAGTRLHLRGGYADGRMQMSGERQAKGKTVTDRITWTDNPDDTVRQLWELSADGGETWQVLFDGLYRPVAPPAKSDAER